MTENQINAAIAEACGWTDIKLSVLAKELIGKSDKHLDYSVIPNYCKDLNAMHEAEKVLRGAEWDTYVDLLADTWIQVAHATARQRAEAFLRTINKWKEAK